MGVMTTKTLYGAPEPEAPRPDGGPAHDPATGPTIPPPDPGPTPYPKPGPGPIPLPIPPGTNPATELHAILSHIVKAFKPGGELHNLISRAIAIVEKDYHKALKALERKK